LVGGFTDFPQYYTKFGGQTICCLIDKFIEVSIIPNTHRGIDIKSSADLPWGIGLGSSGVYYAALVSALAEAKKQKLGKLKIAELAYQLENGIEDNATGRQDSVSCLYRGCSKINYLRDDSVTVDRIPLSREWQKKLDSRLLLFDTGIRRRARDSIKDLLSRRNQPVLDEIAKLPDLLLAAWRKGDIDYLATAISLQQALRSQASPSCTSPRTYDLLRIVQSCGGGARLTGAGLGALLCYCHEKNQERLRRKLGLSEIKFSILW
jgi:galactokinase/mevalonate kinase-like predicted kinase